MAFRKVTSTADLWRGDMAAYTVDGLRVLVVRLDDGVFAYEDRCAHKGAPLSEGTLDGGVLTCGVHLWQYDVRTGHGLNPANCMLRRFPAKEEGGDVLVDVTEVSRDA